MKRLASRLSVASLLVATALTTGCGGSATFVPVTGTVTLDGKPLADAEVAFIPEPSKGTNGENASGFTDAQGRFTLQNTRTGASGVAPGFYRVIVINASGVADLTSPNGAAGNGAGSPGKRADSKQPRLPPVYSDQSRTPLRDVEVKPDSPAQSFDLKSGTR